MDFVDRGAHFSGNGNPVLSCDGEHTMAKEKVTKKQGISNKGISMRFRFLATVIFAVLSVTVFVGGLSIYEVDSYIQDQAKDYVNAVCHNESAQINDSLRNMEKSVKIMESYLMDFFQTEKDVITPAVQNEAIQSAEKMFVDVAKHTSTSGAVSYYFRLNPAISNSTAGLFYCKLNDSDEFVSFEITDLALYEKDDVEHVGWFWQPYEAGEPIWMKPYHNQNNDVLMISYVIPMYFDETFIGVVGMDFNYVVLSEQVHGMKVYDNGFAHLESDGAVICNDDHVFAEDEHGNVEEYLQVSKELVNGMTLVLSASYDDIRQIRYDISEKILVTTVVLAIVFSTVAIMAVQRIADPLKEITDAAGKLSKGDYNVQIPESSTYEIRLLSRAFENMTAQLRQREELLQMSANYDSLTGLRNTTAYAAWVEKFERETMGKNPSFGVVMLDLNGLKKTNDRYGHDVGNELIVTAGRIIADTFKRSPVFRVGGDEFLVVLQSKDLENRKDLFGQFEEKCRAVFVEKDGAKIPVSIAWGCAVFDSEKDLLFADVFKRADEAMYKNKMEAKAALA